MNIAVLFYETEQTPSARFRIRQFESLYQDAQLTLTYVLKSDLGDEKSWSKLSEADLIINQKGLMRKSYLNRLNSLGKPVIFEFDDAIWTRPGSPYSWWTQRRVNSRLKHTLQTSSGVSAASSHLADYARQFSKNVEVVPMALDTKLWCPSEESSEKFIIGWNGSPHNLHHIEGWEKPLGAFLESCPSAELHILCGKKPNWNIPYQHFPFGETDEIEFVKRLSVGLIPLDDHPYSAGKSPIKALQYLACGVPAVGKVLAGGKDFMTSETSIDVDSDDQLLTALTTLSQDHEKRTTMGKAARALVQEKHSLENSFKKMQSLFPQSKA